MRKQRIQKWMVIPAVLFLAASGCATKGFVRTQMSGLRDDMAKVDSQLETQDSKNAELTANALAQADSAYTKAGGAWSAALGRVGLREASRSQIYFAFNSSKLSPESESALSQIASSVSSNPQYAVQIFGFTDPTGPAEYNLELGRRRAEAVERYLVANAPGQLSRYQTISFGEEIPAREASLLGAGKQLRQVLVVMIERTPIGEKEKEGIASR